MAEGARERMAESDYRAAHALLDYRGRAVTSLELGKGDARVIEGQLLRAELLRNQGIIQEARELLSAVLVSLQNQDLPGGAREVSLRACAPEFTRRTSDDAETYFQSAKSLFIGLGRHRERANCVLGLGGSPHLYGGLPTAR